MLRGRPRAAHHQVANQKPEIPNHTEPAYASWSQLLTTVLVLWILGLSLGGCSGSRQSRRAETAPDSTLSTGALTQDLDVLSETVLRVHPMFADSAARADSFERAVQSVQREMNGSMRPSDFFLRVAPLVTALDDGHTFVALPTRCVESFTESEAVFPFDVAFADSTVVVLRSYAESTRLGPGTHLHSINGTSVSTLRDRFLELQPGARTAYRRSLLEGQTDTFKFFLSIVYGIESPFEVRYVDGKQVRQTEVTGVPADTIRSQREDTGRPASAYTVRSLDDSTALLDIRTFGVDENDFEDFLDATFDRLNSNEKEHLIIDVRDNGGGQGDRAAELLRYLVSSPFTLNDSVAVRASEQFKTQMKQNRIPAIVRWLPVQYLDSRGRAVWNAPEGSLVSIPVEEVSPHDENERFEGQVSVLVNEGTFSNATVFASAVKHLGIGTLVGRETGGTGGSIFGEHIPIRLPNSGLWIRVATMQFWFGPRVPNDPARGVQPNHPVPRDLEAQLEGNDPILRAARKRKKANTK